MKKVCKIGFLGMGTVAGGVWKHLSENREEMCRRFGCDFELSKVCVRDVSKPRDVCVPAALLTSNPLDVVDDPDIDVVCELMGGVDEAYKLTMRAFENGKSVITANKALLCHKGADLFAAARKADCGYFFEASVAGGIPIIKIIREGLIANRFSRIYGILNGTCNYILTRMEREGASYEAILADAKKLGYVEQDESLDVDGFDTAHKAAVLAYIAHGKWVPLEDMIIEGIRSVTLDDMLWARDFDYRIKLVANIECDLSTKKLSVRVYPALLPLSGIVSNVNGVFNAVAIDGDVVGESVFVGRGAGRDATASAVISDIADAAERLRGAPDLEFKNDDMGLSMASLKDMPGNFYMRFCVRDEAGILAQITSVFAKVGVSIEQLQQSKRAGDDRAHIVLTTHKTDEQSMEKLKSSLAETSALCGEPFVLRIFKN